MVAWLLVVHIFGFTLWVSGLLMTTFVLLRHIREAVPETRTSLAAVERLALRAMGDPGAFLAILAGIMLITTNSSYYLHARWLHIKFIFVLLMIALHVIVATRSKAFASGRISGPRICPLTLHRDSTGFHLDSHRHIARRGSLDALKIRYQRGQASAITSISTRTSRGSRAACTVEREGKSCRK